MALTGIRQLGNIYVICAADDVPVDSDAIRPVTKDDELIQTLYEQRRKEGIPSQLVTLKNGRSAGLLSKKEEEIAEGEVMANGAEEEAQRAEDAASIGAETEDPGTLTPQLPDEEKPLRLLLIDDPDAPASFLQVRGGVPGPGRHLV